MKNMHYVLLITMISISMSNMNLAQHTTITNKMVVTKSRAIKQLITRHQYVVGSMMVLGYMHQLTYLLPMLKDSAEYFFGEGVKHVAPQQVPQTESLGFFAGIAKDTKGLFGTSQGWRRIFDAGLYMTGQVGTFFVFQKMADMTYHPDTLRWYIHAHVPYIRTIKTIESLTQKLDTQDSMSQEQRAHYAKVLQLSCEQLVGHGTDICAYMAYKSTSSGLSDVQKNLAEKTCRYLLNYQNETFAALFTEVGKERPSYTVISVLMQSYRDELKYQRKLFSGIEAEIHEELQSIGRFS